MLEQGARLSGRYRIERVLGQGGMGAVYLASMESLGGKKVAIKEMELAGGSGKSLEQAASQFRKEATLLAHLDHPNLVKVTDFFSVDGKDYLVMDYVEGETLQERLETKGKPFVWPEVKAWLEPLLDVLQYLHSQKPPILFRDLKPANIMLENGGGLKLIDFGIARTAQAGTETTDFLKGTGTAGFSPIEQYGMGETTDCRSDIYSLGATLYYLLSGKIPADAVSRVSSQKELVALTELASGLPVGLNKLVNRCLAIRQPERFQTISELRLSLKHVGMREDVFITEIVSVEEKNPQRGPKSQGPWAAAFAVVGVATLATMGLFFQNVTNIVASHNAATATPRPAVEQSIDEVRVPRPVKKNRALTHGSSNPEYSTYEASVRAGGDDRKRPLTLEQVEELRAEHRKEQEEMLKKQRRQQQAMREEAMRLARERERNRAAQAKRRPKKQKKRPSLGGDNAYPTAAPKRPLQRPGQRRQFDAGW